MRTRNHELHRETVSPTAQGVYVNITLLKKLLTYVHTFEKMKENTRMLEGKVGAYFASSSQSHTVAVGNMFHWWT
jgi:hypothetical protein